VQIIISLYNFLVFDFSDIQLADTNRDDDALLCRTERILRRSREE